MLTSLDQLDFSGRYTYADYCAWQFEERVELLHGRPVLIPKTGTLHQYVSGQVIFRIAQHLYSQERRFDLLPAPFDVHLQREVKGIEKGKLDIVVQPDISLTFDDDKFDKDGLIGIPDLAVEILNQGNAKREMKDKFLLYEAAGVKEYWIIDPLHFFIIVYSLHEKTGKYTTRLPFFTLGENLKSALLPALKIDLYDIFPEEKDWRAWTR